MKDWLAELFLRQKERIFIDGVSFEEVYRQAQIIGHSLRDAGLKPFDRVALQLPNGLSFVENYFAVLLAGGVVVSISPLLTDYETQKIIAHSGARLLVRSDSRYVLSSGRCVVDLPKDLAAVIYTSGTTSAPKGVMLTSQNIQAQLIAASRAMEIRGEDRMLGILSFAHVFGQMDVMWMALWAGCQVYTLPYFHPKESLLSLQKNKISVLIAVPTMYTQMINASKNLEFPALRVCHSGGAAMSAELFAEIEKFFAAPVQEGYGLTETCSMAFSNPLHHQRKPRSVGKPIQGVKLEIRDEQDRITAEIGEICLRGDIITAGYLGERDLTEESIDQRGYLRTGDLGYLDEDGYLFLLDRKKDLIIRAGHKVYPREIEEVLQEHEMISQVAVIAKEKRLIAYVVTKGEAPDLATDLKILCQERLTRFKRPSKFVFVGELPQTPSGKIQKRKL